MEQREKPVYKYCIVPMCKNTIRKAPDKLFFLVPRGADTRRKWCKIMKRDMISASTCLYCCEDHFNAAGGQTVHETTEEHGKATGGPTQLQEMTAGHLEADGGQQVHETREVHGNATKRQTQLQEMTARHLEADGGQSQTQEATAGQLKAVGGQRQTQEATAGQLKAVGGQRQTQEATAGQLKAVRRQRQVKVVTIGQLEPAGGHAKGQKISAKNVRALSDNSPPTDPEMSSHSTVQLSCRSQDAPNQESTVLRGGSKRQKPRLVSYGYCRFCGELKNNCIDTTKENKLYIVKNKCTLTINDLSVELEFTDDTLKTVCDNCDKKIEDMFEFVKRVKDSQVNFNNFHNKAVERRKRKNEDSQTVNDEEVEEEVPERRKRCRITIDLNSGTLQSLSDDDDENNDIDIYYDDDISSLNYAELADKVPDQSDVCGASVDSDSRLPSLRNNNDNNDTEMDCKIEMDPNSVSFTELSNEESEQRINSGIHNIPINSSCPTFHNKNRDNGVEMSRYLNIYTDFLNETIYNDETNRLIEDSTEPIPYKIHNEPTENTTCEDDGMIIDIKEEDETADDRDNEAHITNVICDDIDIKEEDIEMAIDARKTARLNDSRI